MTSTPAPTITWWYRGLFINNGSTMVSDIGHVPRAATAANFEHNFGHYDQIFHLSSSKSRLSRSRWSTLVQIPLIPEGCRTQRWLVSKSRPIPKASLVHITQEIIFQYYSRMRRGRGQHFTHTTIPHLTGLGNLSS